MLAAGCVKGWELLDCQGLHWGRVLGYDEDLAAGSVNLQFLNP